MDFISKNKLSVFSFFFLFLFYGKVPAIISLSIIAIFYASLEKVPDFKKGLLLLPVILFFIYAISFFWSENKIFWQIDTFRKSALLFFPLFFAFSRPKQSDFQLLFKSFFYASIVFSSGYIFYLFFKLFILGIRDFRELSYINFVIFGHPSYFSMYLDLALAGGGFLFFNKKIKRNIFITGTMVILTAIFLAMSRAGILITILLLFYFLKRTAKIHSLYVFIFLLFSSVAIFNIKRFNPLFDKIINYKTILAKPEKQIYSVELRILTWYATTELIKKNFVLGTGGGDIKDELKKIYKEKNFNAAYAHNLNSHNQFLETFAATGIFGFLSLLAVFLVPFFVAVKKHDDFLIVFLIILGFNFIFESMLNTQAGVIFTAFFYSLIIASQNKIL